MRRATVLAVLLALSGCGGCDDPSDAALTECEQAQVVPGVARTDILFVIDDSGSMNEEQIALEQNLADFIAQLESSPVENQFRIGVTTTSIRRLELDAGTTRELGTFEEGTVAPGVRRPNENLPYPAGRLLAVIPSTVRPDDPATSYDERTLARYDITPGAAPGTFVYGGSRILDAGSATLVQDFTNNTHVGIWGSAKEEGLRAARLALTDRVADGTNAGFLRPGARLAVVIVTDEDDCSDAAGGVVFQQGVTCRGPADKALADPLDGYVEFFRGPIAGEQRSTLVAVIAGVGRAGSPQAGSPALCTGVAGTAADDEADRYRDFITSMGSQGLIASICDPFAATLREIAGLIEPGQTLPLDGAPADWRMLSVSVRRANGEAVGCRLEHAVVGGGDVAGADAVYADPQEGRPATITFQNGCRLGQGDAVSLDLLCAR